MNNAKSYILLLFPSVNIIISVTILQYEIINSKDIQFHFEVISKSGRCFQYHFNEIKKSHLDDEYDSI